MIIVGLTPPSLYGWRGVICLVFVVMNK
jgi:hypothetical protein